MVKSKNKGYRKIIAILIGLYAGYRAISNPEQAITNKILWGVLAILCGSVVTGFRRFVDFFRK